MITSIDETCDSRPVQGSGMRQARFLYTITRLPHGEVHEVIIISNY